MRHGGSGRELARCQDTTPSYRFVSVLKFLFPQIHALAMMILGIKSFYVYSKRLSRAQGSDIMNPPSRATIWPCMYSLAAKNWRHPAISSSSPCLPAGIAIAGSFSSSASRDFEVFGSREKSVVIWLVRNE